MRSRRPERWIASVFKQSFRRKPGSRISPSRFSLLDAGLRRDDARDRRCTHESERHRLSRLELRPRRSGGARGRDRPAAGSWSGTATARSPRRDLIVLPGGFSYGDYLRSGAMAAHSPVMREVASRARAGTPVLGICNGFQVLTEAGLLPGVLMRNATLKFICKDVHLRVERNDFDLHPSLSGGRGRPLPHRA